MKFNAINAKVWSRLGSCGAFGLALVDAVQENDQIVAVTSDLRFYSGLDRFASKFPDRLYNVGIAEQDMIGVAAGMAKEGLVPFATTYATFASMRAADQVRVNMGYMNLPIKLIGLTSGLSVGILGPTHISLEDIAVMRSIPNITILSPADCTETCKAVLAAPEIEGPVYIRLTGPQDNPIVYDADYCFEVGKAVTLQEGEDIAIIATGTMVHTALGVAQRLEQEGFGTKVVDMHTIRPLDIEAIEGCLNVKLLVTMEEHGVVGGLGAAVAESISEYPKKPSHVFIGCATRYEHAGSYPYLIEQYGLTERQVFDAVMDKMREV